MNRISIEVLGLGNDNPFDREKGGKLIKSLWSALEGVPYGNAIVITGVFSQSRNSPNNDIPTSQHFVRVWATDKNELDDVLTRIKPLRIDIEVTPLLTQFIGHQSEKTARYRREYGGLNQPGNHVD